MAQTVDQVYNSLNASYDPLRVANDQQQATAQQDANTQLSSLDQAKANAFKEIDLSANRKGMLFSGFSPNEEAGYLGTKYLPARADISSKLLSTLNQLRTDNANIGAKQRGVAEQTVNDQIKQEREDAYRQAQLGLSYARLQSSQSRAGGISPSLAYQMSKDTANAYKVTSKKGGGYSFTGPNGRPLSLGQYVQGAGGDANTVLDLLKNGSAYDKKIYNAVNIRLRGGNYKISSDPQSILNTVAQLDTGNYYGLR